MTKQTLGFADKARQALSAARAGYGADDDLGLAELGLLARQDDVAHHGELAAAAEREAVHGGDDGRLGLGQRRPVRQEVALAHVAERLVLHLLDVGAGGEGTRRAGQHHACDLRMGVERPNGRAQLVHELGAQGVERLGSVELNEAHVAIGALHLGQYVLVGGRRRRCRVGSSHVRAAGARLQPLGRAECERCSQCARERHFNLYKYTISCLSVSDPDERW